MLRFIAFILLLMVCTSVCPAQQAEKTVPPEKTAAEEAKPADAGKRVELNMLGKTDSASGESRRNENVQFNLIDNNALKDLNIRLGTTATIVPEFQPQRPYLGVEFGSTRIKAVLIGPDHASIASGSFEWENRFEDGVWTYPLEDVWRGLQASYAELSRAVLQQYGRPLTTIGAIGFSGMMHGYLPFDDGGQLLAPFRTWRNTMTGPAAAALTELFQFNIPQRWSIAHLEQAILNHEPHVASIRHLTTLAGYVHWQLTGQKVMGIGEASGMFPIDSTIHDYDQQRLAQYDAHIAGQGYSWTLAQILPKVLVAGEPAGTLTEAGARLIDPSGTLRAGIPLCPPEGDAGTGMVATNSVAPRTGNVSAGTSVFAMIVLEQALSKLYPEIDLVTTPTGKPVAMVHSNNCTTDLNAWVDLFGEFAGLLGVEVSQSKLFELLYRAGLGGDAEGGNLLAYNYYSGEHIRNKAAGERWADSVMQKILDLNANLERKVEERTTELLAANQELESFSYSISHDLRSPLRAIDGFSKALSEDAGELLPRESMVYLDRIRLASQRMGQLIDDLLTLSRVSRNRWPETAIAYPKRMPPPPPKKPKAAPKPEGEAPAAADAPLAEG